MLDERRDGRSCHMILISTEEREEPCNLATDIGKPVHDPFNGTLLFLVFSLFVVLLTLTSCPLAPWTQTMAASEAHAVKHLLFFVELAWILGGIVGFSLPLTHSRVYRSNLIQVTPPTIVDIGDVDVAVLDGALGIFEDYHLNFRVSLSS